jgi:hypothetical protein
MSQLQLILVVVAIVVITAAHIAAAMRAADVIAAAARPAASATNKQGGGENGFPEKILNFRQRAARPIDYRWFETTNASVYSSLMPWHLRSKQDALLHEFADAARAAKSNFTIVDATAHVGVDAANFRVLFPRAAITAIEIDPAVAAVARRNMARVARATRLPAPEVRAADGAAFIKSLGKQGALETQDGAPAPDVLYLDPPWGGAGASLAAADAALAHRRLHLELGGEPLPEVVADALRRGVGAVAVKLPRESDTAAFAAAVVSARGAPVRTVAHAICDDRRSSARRPGALPGGVRPSRADCGAAGAPVGYWLLVSRD